MYYAHFGLKEPPFKITPNTDVFFTGANRGAVLDALIYAITNNEGIVKVVGEVGSGKTMLCRMLQAMLPESVESIFLANPSVAPEHVLNAIAFELQLKIPKTADRLKVMQMLQSYLVARHGAGKQVVVFVEEAQSMPLATLEEIRLLSNLETKHHKLLQIVLFGQPELDVNLNQTNIRQLRERITHSFNLGPLNASEIEAYLIFRLRAAGYFGPPIFTKAAVKKISASAQGLVRRVNILADKALLATFADNTYLVTPKHVNAAINDSEFGSKISPKPKKNQLLLGTCILIAGLSLGYLVSQYKRYPMLNLADLITHPVSKNMDKTSVKNKPITKPMTIKPIAIQPIAIQPIAIQPIAIQPIVHKPTANKPALNTNNASDSAIESSSLLTATETQLPATALINTSSLVNNFTLATSTSHAPAISLTKTPALVVASADHILQDALNKRLQATSAWLLAQPPATVTIQLMGVDDEVKLESELNLLAQKIERDNIHVYRTKIADNTLVERPYFTVLYGNFTDRQQAIQEMQKLPASVRKNQPQLRTIAGILQETK